MRQEAIKARTALRLKALVMSVVICLSAGFLALPANAQSPITNGSFETGDYTGWTLFEGPGGDATFGTWGIAQDGQTIEPQESTFDFSDGILVEQSSIGLPKTYTATDGKFVAYQLQNFLQMHRMSQDIEVCDGATQLTWDMEYTNHTFFDRDLQNLAVEIRDLEDNVLATLFTTDPANPTIPGNPGSIILQSFSGDISQFAGQTIRLAVEMIVRLFVFDAVFDNFRIEGCEAVEVVEVINVPIDIKPGGNPNSINRKSKGVIPVAILGSDTFAVTAVDVSTLYFGPDEAEPVHGGHIGDVNNDGFNDLVLHFRTQDAGFQCGDTVGVLTGELLDGTPSQGSNAVRIVRCK